MSAEEPPLKPHATEDIGVREAHVVGWSRTWQDQYERMVRAYHRARAASTASLQAEDDYYCFFVWCFHLKDWLQNDPSVPAATKRAVEELVEANESLRLCADLANGIKHLRASRKARVDPDSTVRAILATFYPGDAQTPMFQTGERIVVFAAGNHQDALKLADECVALWTDFLKQHGL